MTTPVIMILGAWVLFGGSHLLLSWLPVRRRLSGWLGDTKFVAVYAGIAAASLLLLAAVVAAQGGNGPAGLNLAAVPAARWALGAAALAGAALVVAGLAAYPRSAMAVLARRLRASSEVRRRPLQGPTPIERVVRHPFFVGLAIMMAAHVAMATTLTMLIYFSGFALLALIGIPMQDRKLRQQHGNVYGRFEKATSNIPLAAARNRKEPPPDKPGRIVTTGILGGALIGCLHPLWQLNHGAWFAVAVAVGGLLATALQFWRAHQRGQSPMQT